MYDDIDDGEFETALAEGRMGFGMSEQYSIDDHTIAQCYGRAATSASHNDEADLDDLFFDELVSAGCDADEADEIVENYNG